MKITKSQLKQLIKEELEELKIAIDTKNLVEVADALTDILYVTYGAGCAYGIDLDKCFKEVQRANMSKLGEDGKPIFNDKGKVMSAIMPKVRGKADGAVVNKIVMGILDNL